MEVSMEIPIQLVFLMSLLSLHITYNLTYHPIFAFWVWPGQGAYLSVVAPTLDSFFIDLTCETATIYTFTTASTYTSAHTGHSSFLANLYY